MFVKWDSLMCLCSGTYENRVHRFPQVAKGVCVPTNYKPLMVLIAAGMGNWVHGEWV